MSKKLYLITVFTFSLIACSQSKNSSSNSGSVAKPGQDLSRNFKADEITKPKYTLLEDLNFDQAERHEITNFAGTDMEYKSVTYVYTFQNQHLISAAERESAPSYCSLTTEASLTTQVKDITFPAYGKLIVGQLSQSTSNASFDFSLQLQGQVFQSFFLNCHNVIDAEGVAAHVGQILQATP